MHTLVSKLVALSVEKYYMAVTEIQSKICRFHRSLSQKCSRPLICCIASWPSMVKITAFLCPVLNQKFYIPGFTRVGILWRSS